MYSLKKIVKRIKFNSFERDDILSNIMRFLKFIDNHEKLTPCDHCSSNGGNLNLNFIFKIVNYSLLFNWIVTYPKIINLIKNNRNLYHTFKDKLEEFSTNEFLKESILWKGEDYYLSYLVD